MKNKNIASIFKILRQGQFICSNSPDEQMQRLYNYLDDTDNFEQLYDYFLHIDYVLEQGDEFFYFSRQENNATLQNKLDRAFDWIDWVDFFKTYDSAFDVGYRFSAAEIVSQLTNNADLKNKLEKLKGIDGQKKNYPERVQKLINKLDKENFVTLENEMSQTYKILTSFNYLKDLINSICLMEDDNEISE